VELANIIFDYVPLTLTDPTKGQLFLTTLGFDPALDFGQFKLIVFETGGPEVYTRINNFGQILRISD
jgi:hypothetical protein